MTTALERLKEEFISSDELAIFFGITKKRLHDQISLHKTQNDFMPAYKAAAGMYYFKFEDVRRYLISKKTVSETFSNKEE